MQFPSKETSTQRNKGNQARKWPCYACQDRPTISQLSWLPAYLLYGYLILTQNDSNHIPVVMQLDRQIDRGREVLFRTKNFWCLRFIMTLRGIQRVRQHLLHLGSCKKRTQVSQSVSVWTDTLSRDKLVESLSTREFLYSSLGLLTIGGRVTV